MPHEYIKTIAVLDLETNGLPCEQNNTCAITELCIYAFPAKCFGNWDNKNANVNDKDSTKLKDNDNMEGVKALNKGPPELPRILHKITMMIKPEKKISSTATGMTGLTNDMLDGESPFDTNTANCLLTFLKRLEKPVCLVAHNGWKFDFPVLNYVMRQISMSFPSSIYCIDSFKAFRELDEKPSQIREISSIINNEMSDLMALDKWRYLFTDQFQPKNYVVKGTYVLGNIYKRRFKENSENLHCAESDVIALTKIILSYGLIFLAYMEQRKKAISNVPRLGSKT